MGKKIFYNNPAISFSTLFRALFIFSANAKLKNFFRQYTGKKYILITSSTRSALFLGYKALGLNGTVLTSPLTCSVAITPIIEAGGRVKFVDVRHDALTPDYNSIDLDQESDKIVAVQVIHLGGIRSKFRELAKHCRKHNIFLIEDCAQSFNPFFLPKEEHRDSDIVCYSLIKNFFGLSGGILATDDINIYKKAREIQESFPKQIMKLIIFRILKGFLMTYRSTEVTNRILGKLIRSVEKIKISEHKNTLVKEFVKPSVFNIKFAAAQLKNISELNFRRMAAASVLTNKLAGHGIGSFYDSTSDSSFVKYYFCGSGIMARDIFDNPVSNEIEFKHLSENFVPRYQPMLVGSQEVQNNQRIEEFPNYYKIHDSIVTLPLRFDMSTNEIHYLAEMLSKMSIGENEKEDMV